MKIQSTTKFLLAPLAVACSLATAQVYAESGSIADAVKNGKANLSFRMRYEEVDVDLPSSNTGKDNAHAATLKSRLTFNTDSYQGFGLGLEFDDVSTVDDNDYNPNKGYSQGPVILDAEYTEVNQAFIAYTGLDKTNIKYGRQRILLDNQRFVGGVGFRQNEQTYDALSVTNTSAPDTKIFAAYLFDIQPITGEDNDVRTDTTLLNATYSGFSAGVMTAYAYNIDHANDVNKFGESSRTMGARFNGSCDCGEGDIKYVYGAEIARQSDTGDNPTSYDANYLFAEGGIVVSGVTAKLGYEILGSDDGLMAFQTPLATKHAFQGWADQFLGTPKEGIKDLQLTVAGKALGIDLKAVYHKFNSDENNSVGDDDLGSEVDLVASKNFGAYGLMFEYATYSAGDETFVQNGKSAFNNDVNKLWLTATASF